MNWSEVRNLALKREVEKDRQKPVSAFSNTNKKCNHKFVFLRREANKDLKQVDVFFCEKCLKYKNK